MLYMLNATEHDSLHRCNEIGKLPSSITCAVSIMTGSDFHYKAVDTSGTNGGARDPSCLSAMPATDRTRGPWNVRISENHRTHCSKENIGQETAKH